jgi:hypothetical protein
MEISKGSTPGEFDRNKDVKETQNSFSESTLIPIPSLEGGWKPPFPTSCPVVGTLRKPNGGFELHFGTVREAYIDLSTSNRVYELDSGIKYLETELQLGRNAPVTITLPGEPPFQAIVLSSLQVSPGSEPQYTVRQSDSNNLFHFLPTEFVKYHAVEQKNKVAVQAKMEERLSESAQPASESTSQERLLQKIDKPVASKPIVTTVPSSSEIAMDKPSEAPLKRPSAASTESPKKRSCGDTSSYHKQSGPDAHDRPLAEARTSRYVASVSKPTDVQEKVPVKIVLPFIAGQGASATDDMTDIDASSRSDANLDVEKKKIARDLVIPRWADAESVKGKFANKNFAAYFLLLLLILL